MGNHGEKNLDERAFVKGAYQALIDRGVITDDIYDLDEDTMLQIRDMDINAMNELDEDELPYGHL